jgi:hypothetical protein
MIGPRAFISTARMIGTKAEELGVIKPFKSVHGTPWRFEVHVLASVLITMWIQTRRMLFFGELNGGSHEP